MRIKKSEWKELGPELVKRRICKSIEKERLIFHGLLLVNAILGGGKGKCLTNAPGKRLEALRLLIFLVPSNDIQEVIEGDVATPPHFGQWAGFELMDDEILLWSSVDVSCAFHIFSQPDERFPYYVIHWPLDPSFWGGSGDEADYLAMWVIPMGWRSAVGITSGV